MTRLGELYKTETKQREKMDIKTDIKTDNRQTLRQTLEKHLALFNAQMDSIPYLSIVKIFNLIFSLILLHEKSIQTVS